MGKIFPMRLNAIIIGPRFNDEVYFYMSRGLIEPSILESIINQQILPAILLAPNLSFVEAWESSEFKSYY
jgi:Temperature dependent protein affecting M2 dsRNA replication